jgi:hypothetical protein
MRVRVRPLDETTWPDFARLGDGTLQSYPDDADGLREPRVRANPSPRHHWVVAKVVG